MRLFFIFIPVLFLNSCSVLDYPLRFAGFSTQKFKNEKNGRFKKDFALSKKEAFKKILLELVKLRARVTHKNFKSGYIIAFDWAKSFDFCLDSTEAGIFISETEYGVDVEIISDNSILAKHISDKLFEMLAI
jgi:hypothetical protein